MMVDGNGRKDMVLRCMMDGLINVWMVMVGCMFFKMDVDGKMDNCRLIIDGDGYMDRWIDGWYDVEIMDIKID
jgi:hypothetical protein